MIQDNIVTNVTLWDGDVNSWQPPSNVIMLVAETVPTKVWGLVNNEYVLVDSVGDAVIGFTYADGVCTTHEPKPEYKEPDGEIPSTTV